jgi:hypothetical protein
LSVELGSSADDPFSVQFTASALRLFNIGSPWLAGRDVEFGLDADGTGVATAVEGLRRNSRQAASAIWRMRATAVVREVLAGAIDTERQHRHRRLKRPGLRR